MASEVQIANMAAILVGVAGNIASLDDDRTIARRLKAAWVMSRQAAIRDGAWNFAARRARIAEKVVAEDDKYPWAFAYAEPAQSLRLIEVDGMSTEERCPHYLYENRLILTNIAAPLPIRFMIDVPEPAYWDALFAKAFAAMLALTIGKSVAGSNYDDAKGERDYRRLIAASRRVDARENPNIAQAESDWITARWRGNGGYDHSRFAGDRW